jgi:hypothetical protein
MRQLNYEERARSHGSPPLSRMAETIVMAAIAVALLVPCFWQPRILAGDLPSHVYNAWLATLAEQGEAPGLVLAHPATNVLSDWALQGLLHLMGPGWAERIVAGAAVEIFFWGAFVFVGAVAGQRCWVIAPSLGMLAYGLIFQMGFLNFYLATGLSLWLMALLWKPQRPWVWLALPLAVLALLAHALPLAWAGAAMLYVYALRRSPAAYGGLLFLGGIALLILAQTVMFRFLPARWSLADVVGLEGMLGVSGAEQLWLYGLKYMIPVGGILVIWFLLFLERLDRRSLGADPAAHLWGLCIVAMVLLPSTIQFPQYNFGLRFVPQRVALLVALLFCALVAGGRHGRSRTRASLLLAVVFFTALYLDMQSLNQVGAEITRLAAALPPGQRVVAAVRDTGSSGLNGLAHVASAVCAGRCYDFGNYEPATGAFRLRVLGVNGVVADSMEVVSAIENGVHVVTPQEAPIYSVCAPDGPGPRLVLRKLAAGEKTCLVTIPVTPQF